MSRDIEIELIGQVDKNDIGSFLIYKTVFPLNKNLEKLVKKNSKKNFVKINGKLYPLIEIDIDEKFQLPDPKIYPPKKIYIPSENNKWKVKYK